MNFSPQARFQILNILPQETGSLQQSIQIKRLRDEISFTEEEKEILNMDPQTGSFDPSNMNEIGSVDMDLSDGQREILAGSVVRLEDDESVPTNDTFVELVLELEDEIEDFREQIN